MSILKLENIVKAYNKHLAVDDVSFDVPNGRIFGLLGPNGAGKTSLIRIITTITRADSGTVYLDGEKLNSRHPSQIGYMPEERGLYRKMKVGEHLMYLAQLKDLNNKEAKAAIMEWFEKFDIEDWWDKKVDELSKGMQQKIQFICTVVHNPKLLILDEPFSGLDPINTNLIKAEIHRMHNEGVSIILSTHRMEQVEEICQQIVLINKGKNILEGDVKEIRNQFKDNIFRVDYSGELPSEIDNIGIIKELNDHYFSIQLDEEEKVTDLLKFLLDKGVHINAFNEILPPLNEIFIRQVEDSNLFDEAPLIA